MKILLETSQQLQGTSAPVFPTRRSKEQSDTAIALQVVSQRDRNTPHVNKVTDNTQASRDLSVPFPVSSPSKGNPVQNLGYKAFLPAQLHWFKVSNREQEIAQVKNCMITIPWGGYVGKKNFAKIQFWYPVCSSQSSLYYLQLLHRKSRALLPIQGHIH